VEELKSAGSSRGAGESKEEGNAIKNKKAGDAAEGVGAVETKPMSIKEKMAMLRATNKKVGNTIRLVGV
jgi:hypothetical protein